MKRFLCLSMLGVLISAAVAAEQPKAVEYRKILTSGDYYVEYDYPLIEKALAVKAGKRMDYTMGKAKSIGIAFLKVPVADKARKPSAFYQDGKYYQFDEAKKKYAQVIYENQLSDVNLDPKRGWNTVRARLALPEELAVYAPNDPFNKYIDGFERPIFVESGKKDVVNKKGKKETFTYDKYSANHNSLSGEKLYVKNYYFLFDEVGDLKKIQTTFKAGSYEEREIQIMTIKKITSRLPENAGVMPNGYRVYAAGTGDMNDLIEQLPMVEDYREKDNEEAGK